MTDVAQGLRAEGGANELHEQSVTIFSSATKVPLQLLFTIYCNCSKNNTLILEIIIYIEVYEIQKTKN